MSGEWKPGDVAMVNCSDGEWCQAVCVVDGGPLAWLFADGARRRAGESAARSLVVIDPEDASQLAALSKALVEAAYNHGNLIVSDNGIHESTVRLALDNFASPKPEEPIGLGAVVEDARGGLYVRSRIDDIHPWSGPDHGHYSWRGTEAVKVLSEGVTA